MRRAIRVLACAAASFLLEGLAPAAASADGIVNLEIRPSNSTADYTVELVEVKKKADGTSEEVPVKDRDGTPIKASMNKLRTLANKPPSDENPDGGRVSENEGDRRKERIQITLPAGTYRFRIVNDKTGEKTESGKFVVPEGAGTGQKDADGNKIRSVKLTMSANPASVYIPEGYRVAQAEGAQLEPGQEYAAAPGASGSEPYTGWEIALTPGGSFGSIGTRQLTSFGGKSNGKDIHYEAANLHADVRYYVGGVGSVGGWEPSLLVGLKGAGTFGGGERGLEEDNHPPFGDDDSFVKYEIDGSLTPYFGLTLVDCECSRMNLLIGPRITFASVTGITDESGGGGVRERFTNDEVQVGPAVGLELDIPISRMRYGGVEGGVRIATWGEYLPGISASGASSTFPFDYRFGTRDAFLFTVRAGFFARFDGL